MWIENVKEREATTVRDSPQGGFKESNRLQWTIQALPLLPQLRDITVEVTRHRSQVPVPH